MSIADSGCGPSPYLLGHSAEELLRLTLQARLLEPITRRFLIDAGITTGMRVLDVGSGMGDVSFLVAELVGPAGEVVGADRAPPAVAAARERAKAKSVTNATFLQGDPAVLRFDKPFDAVVGRYVLMYQHDPATMLRALTACLRAGGVIVFHELDWGGARSFPPAPTYDTCCRWVIDALKCGGADAYMGTKLCSTFAQAGLPPPVMRLEAIIGGAGDRTGAARDFIATMLPTSVIPTLAKFGIATAAEIDAQTLPDRIYQEISQNGSAIIGRSEVGAWSRRQ